MDGQIHSIPDTAIRGCEDIREYRYYIYHQLQLIHIMIKTLYDQLECFDTETDKDGNRYGYKWRRCKHRCTPILHHQVHIEMQTLNINTYNDKDDIIG